MTLTYWPEMHNVDFLCRVFRLLRRFLSTKPWLSSLLMHTQNVEQSFQKEHSYICYYDKFLPNDSNSSLNIKHRIDFKNHTIYRQICAHQLNSSLDNKIKYKGPCFL